MGSIRRKELVLGFFFSSEMMRERRGDERLIGVQLIETFSFSRRNYVSYTLRQSAVTDRSPGMDVYVTLCRIDVPYYFIHLFILKNYIKLKCFFVFLILTGGQDRTDKSQIKTRSYSKMTEMSWTRCFMIFYVVIKGCNN